jgi:hypothetical protein
MKRSSKSAHARIPLGRVSRSTMGDVKGVIEAFGLYTPRVQIL